MTDATHLRALAARCREEGPSRELDGPAAKAFGYRHEMLRGSEPWGIWYPPEGVFKSSSVDPPRLTASLDAIVGEIERALPGAYIDLTIQRTGRGSAGVVPKGGDVSHALARTPALALCAALLEALAAKEEGENAKD